VVLRREKERVRKMSGGLLDRAKPLEEEE